MMFLGLNKFINEDTNAIHSIITKRQLKLNDIKFGNYLQKRTKQSRLGFWIERSS